MSAPREKTIPIGQLDLVGVLDQVSDIRTSAACARLILRGIQSLEADSEAYDPLHSFLLRLEGEIDALSTTANGMMGGADVVRA